MSNGYHFIYLPILFALVIPLALLVYALTIDTQIDFDFFFYVFIVISAILIFINIFDLTQVFVYRKGNVKKLSNAIRGKNILKLFVYVSVVGLAASITLQILIPLYPDIVPDDKIDTINYGNIAIVIFYLLYMFIFSVSAIIPVLIRNDYFRGSSFAYFQIGINKKNMQIKFGLIKMDFFTMKNS